MKNLEEMTKKQLLKLIYTMSNSTLDLAKKLAFSRLMDEATAKEVLADCTQKARDISNMPWRKE